MRLERESENRLMTISVLSPNIGGVIYHRDRRLEQEPKVASKIGEMVAAGWAT